MSDMNYATARRVLLLALLAVCGAGGLTHADKGTPTDVSDEEFALPVDERMAADIDRLIAQLGSPRYQERVAATDGLIEIGAPSFGKLRTAYHGTDDLEVRLRIERIVFTAYLDHHVYSRHAFLGISLQPYTPRAGDTVELPPGTRGVAITNVIQDTAAERAGLQRKDVIIAADGQSLGRVADIVTTFSQTIASRPPGAHMTLSVARGGEVHDVDVTLGRCPRERVQQTRIRDKYDAAAARFLTWWKEYFLKPSTASTP